MKYLIFVILLLAVLITAGCTSETPKVVAAPTITTIQTTIPTTAPTTIQTPNPSIIANKTKNVTAAPTVKPTIIPDVTDISSITFAKWSNGILSMDYPNTWTIETKTENNIKLPWRTGNKFLNRIEISNPAKTVAYTITVWDVGTGAWKMNQYDKWLLSEVQYQFAGVAPQSITGFGGLCSIDGIQPINCMKYTVTTPKMKLFRYRAVTLRYGYTFELISTSPTKYDAYENLGEYMTNTIKLSDMRSS